MCFKVPSICICSFFQAFDNLKDDFPPAASQLLPRFENFIVGKAHQLPGDVIRMPPRFPPESWSAQPFIAAEQPQGNDATQSWHSCFPKVVGTPHPGFSRFFSRLQQEHQATQDKTESLLRSQKPPKQKRAIVAREESLMCICLNRRQMLVKDFLRVIAHNLNDWVFERLTVRLNA